MIIGICDDENEIRDMLACKIQSCYPEADIEEYASGNELLESEIQPDILFLDIQMSGRNGMETARELRKRKARTVIIFITAIKEYVFQAFDVGALHYLVKPFSDEKFAEVLTKAVTQYKELQEYISGKEGKFILIKTGGVRTKIVAEDIVYAEVFNRKVTIHKVDGMLEYYGKLSDLEKQLGENFFRTHRAYLVHYKYVESYNASCIFMGQGSALMAKAKFPDFVKGYLRYNKRRGKDIF